MEVLYDRVGGCMTVRGPGENFHRCVCTSISAFLEVVDGEPSGTTPSWKCRRVAMTMDHLLTHTHAL